MKRSLAVITALMMTAAVGCGNVNDVTDYESTPAAAAEGTTAETEQSVRDEVAEEEAETDEKGTSEAAESAETAVTESGSSESVDSSEAEESTSSVTVSNGWLNEKNCAVIDDYQDSGNDPYDKQVLYKMAELAAAQYNAIIDRDKQTYFDSVNVKGLLKSDGMAAAIANDFSDDDMPEMENELYIVAVMLMYEQLDETYTKLYEDYYNDSITEEELTARTAEIISEAADNLSADNAGELFDEYSAFNFLFSEENDRVPQQLKDSPADFRILPAEDMICSVEIDGYNTSERGAFAELDIVFAVGDWEYILDECYIWLSGDSSAVYVSDIMVRENEVKGKTLDELLDDHETEQNVKRVNAAAKIAFNAAAEFFADSETQGISLDELIENGSFANMTSKDGLTIDDTGSADGAKGDAFVKSVLSEGGYSGGSVFLGFNGKADSASFFVQYRDSDGNIGQYPHAALSHERAGRITWGTYLPPDPEDSDS